MSKFPTIRTALVALAIMLIASGSSLAGPIEDQNTTQPKTDGAAIATEALNAGFTISCKPGEGRHALWEFVLISAEGNAATLRPIAGSCVANSTDRHNARGFASPPMESVGDLQGVLMMYLEVARANHSTKRTLYYLVKARLDANLPTEGTWYCKQADGVLVPVLNAEFDPPEEHLAEHFKWIAQYAGGTLFGGRSIISAKIALGLPEHSGADGDCVPTSVRFPTE